MADAQASSAGRELARARWTPSPVVLRSAQLVIERVAELPDGLREQVHEATAQDTEEAHV
jgi:hypothetical protein